MICSNRPRIKEIINVISIFSLLFLNMDISVTIYIINLRFSVCILKVVLEGRVSQISYLGPSFYFMAKKGNFLLFYSIQNSSIHKIKTRT